LGPPPVASVASSLEAGSLEASVVVTAVTSVAFAAVGSDAAPSDVPVVQGKQFFFFPPVLEDVPTFAGLAKRSSGPKTALRREAIQLYRITRKELEHRISTACSVYFVDKDWG
jgi:hypothetical protein